MDVLVSEPPIATIVNGNSITENGSRESEWRTPIGRAIAWLQHYVDAHPYTENAEEARWIINELLAVRNRPAFDELPALLGQIAKTDQSFQEIHRAKTQINESNKDLAVGHEIKIFPKLGAPESHFKWLADFNEAKLLIRDDHE